MTYTPLKTVTVTQDGPGSATGSCPGCPGVMIHWAQRAAHQTWHASVGVDPAPVITPATQKVTGLTAVESTPGAVTLAWKAPTAAAPTAYTVGRDGTEAGGGSPNWSGAAPAGTTTFTFTALAPATVYTFTITPTPGVAVTIKLTTKATAPIPATPGADWVSHFASKTLFQKDWYGAPDGGAGDNVGGGGGNDPASGTWVAGHDNDFYPYDFHVDPAAPGGEYVRIYCDRLSKHPSDAGKVHNNSSWIGNSALTKRGFSSGYTEFCARFPSAGCGEGMFPALWMYKQANDGSGTDNTGAFTQSSAGAPGGGNELDFLEIFGKADVMEFGTTLHCPNPSGGYTGNTDKDTWHTWGMYWDANTLDFYYDHVKKFSAPSDAGKFAGMQFQLRIDYVTTDGASWVSPQFKSTSATPDSLFMDVAYVRHFPKLPF